jgi:AcrR family transcriptional regulator
VEAIVGATAHILKREGTAHVTTNRVAERAGVSIGSLYQYFSNKEALVAEVRRRYEETFRERMLTLSDAVATRPLPEAIAECVQVLIAVHREDVGLHNAVSAAGIGDPERRLLHRLAAGWLEARRDVVRRPDRALAAAVAVDAAEALVHGVALRAPERLEDEAFAAEVTDLLVRYLAE